MEKTTSVCLSVGLLVRGATRPYFDVTPRALDLVCGIARARPSRPSEERDLYFDDRAEEVVVTVASAAESADKRIRSAGSR